MNKRCIIIGGGDCSTEIINQNINKDDFIICADSGYDYLINTHYIPDLVIGDFDSIKHNVSSSCSIIKLPIEKDITDTEAALNKGIDLGYKSFVILGGTGGRFEHTFANISLIAKMTVNNYNCIMIDDRHKYMCIHNSNITIDKIDNEQISVFAFGEIAKGVTEEGFHYSISNYSLDPFEPIGISNDIVDKQGIISVNEGTLIIIETKM